MSGGLDVGPDVAVILYEAYAKLTGHLSRNHFALYDYVRVVMSKLTSVDAFYVGLLYSGNRVRFPYNFDGERYDDSDSHTIGRDGLAAWLIANRRTYRFDSDGGALLNKGISFGDVRRRTADAVTVPLMRTTGDGQDVFGMLSMQSYQAHVYTGEAIAALEWLAAIVARILTREQEDRETLANLRPTTDHADGYLTSDRVVEYLVEQVGTVRRRAERALARPDVNDEVLRTLIAEIVEDCRRIQAELVEMTLLVDDRPSVRFASLTPAEQTIAMLVADGLSNQEIAERLRPTSVNTVKTHLKNIAAKYGMGQRAQIAADVRRHLGQIHPTSAGTGVEKSPGG